MQVASPEPVGVVTGGGRDAGTRWAEPLLRVVTKAFTRRPDASLANEKFTDDLERELLRRTVGARTW
jgi:hypothetical protein